LAGLLDHAGTNDIQTVTFGTPGTWDFEIPKDIAQQAGVDHLAVQIKDIEWSISHLKDTARKTGVFGQYFPLTIFRQAIYDRFDESVIWDGFMGEALTGAHLSPSRFEDWDAACEWFCSWSARLDSEFKDINVAKTALPDVPFVDKSALPFDEQLDYGVRQQCFIRPRPTDSIQLYPFLQDELAEFLLFLPRDWRQERTFYKELVQKWKPDFFEIPTQANYGLGLSAPEWRQKLKKVTIGARKRIESLYRDEIVYPGQMYWDWDAAIRDRPALRETIHELIKSLSVRDIGLQFDPERIYNRHLGGDDLSDTLRILASYEVWIQVSDR